MSIKNFVLDGFVFELSIKTLDHLLEHEAYCAVGRDWLERNDPECEREWKIFERMKDSVQNDLEIATANLSTDARDDLLDSLWDIPCDDLFVDIRDA